MDMRDDVTRAGDDLATALAALVAAGEAAAGIAGHRNVVKATPHLDAARAALDGWRKAIPMLFAPAE